LRFHGAPPTQHASGWAEWRPRFADYDIVIQTCNDFGGGPSWPSKVQEDFQSFVRNFPDATKTSVCGEIPLRPAA